MLSLRLFYVITLLLFSGLSAAKEPAQYDSLRLVSAMREDERILRSAMTAKLRQSGLSEQDMECLERFEYPQITDIVASQISARMTAVEVRDALAYFQGASGRKLVERELQKAGEVSFTKAEQVQLDRFKRRPAGRKLLRDLILKNAATTSEVMARLDRHLRDCAFRRQMDLARGTTEESCRARAVASADNTCLATYIAEGDSSAPQRASVEVNCRNDGRVLTSRIGLQDVAAPVALRWSNDRELQILVDGKLKNVAPAGSSVKTRFLPRKRNDPAPLECLPQTRGSPTLAEALPPNIAVGAWRAHIEPGLCLMTARVLKKEVAGADGDTLLQFRRQTPAVPPFATTELALVVQIYQQTPQPSLVGFGQKRLTLITQPPRQMHMLVGQAAEAALQGLQSRPIELSVRPASAPGYSIPVSRLDFDLAYARFSECSRSLATR